MMNERQMRLSDPEGFRARISSIFSSPNLVPDLLCQWSDFDDFARRMAIANGIQFASPGTLAKYRSTARTSHVVVPRCCEVVAPRPPESAVPPVSRLSSHVSLRITVETQRSEDAGQDRVIDEVPAPGVMPVPELEEPGDGEVVLSENVEPALEVDQPQGVNQLEHAV